MKDWTAALSQCLLVMQKLGAETFPLQVLPPAGEDAVAAVERKLGKPIPQSFREVLTHYSAGVKFYWQLPEEYELPEELREIFAGELSWDVDQVEPLYENYRGWIDNCFPNEADAYDRVWHGKFPVLAVPNGDIIAISTSGDRPGAVVNLSHEGSDLHGYCLADDFQDFLERYIALYCPGPEEWQLEPFLLDARQGIQTECPNAKLWLSFIQQGSPPSATELAEFNVLRERGKQRNERQFHLAILAEATDPAERLGIYSVDPELALNAGLDVIHKELAAVPKEHRRHVASALVAFHDPSSLDWIEQNVPTTVTGEWGRLAAASQPDWQRMCDWLSKGRPLSLVALDALIEAVPDGVVDLPPVEDVEAVLLAYACNDNVPRVNKAIEGILAKLR